jgi:hypothetical protein
MAKLSLVPHMPNMMANAIHPAAMGATAQEVVNIERGHAM